MSLSSSSLLLLCFSILSLICQDEFHFAAFALRKESFAALHERGMSQACCLLLPLLSLPLLLLRLFLCSLSEFLPLSVDPALGVNSLWFSFLRCFCLAFRPSGEVLDAINASFGSFEKCMEQLEKTVVGHFGSGWAWIVQQQDGKLAVIDTHDGEIPLTHHDHDHDHHHHHHHHHHHSLTPRSFCIVLR